MPVSLPLVEALSDATALYARHQVLTRPCPVPAVAGMYAWYFADVPNAPLQESTGSGQFRLAYIGIAPGRPGSKATLRSRLRQHLRGNASSSTLRLTLGCLLAETLGLRLEPTGKTRRLTWGPAGERALSTWLEQNARVVWSICDDPWAVESDVIKALRTPLNLDHNRHHGFSGELLEFRRQARMNARS